MSLQTALQSANVEAGIGGMAMPDVNVTNVHVSFRTPSQLPYAKGGSSRSSTNPDLCVQTVLQPAEVDWLLKRDHTPNACTLMLSTLCKSLDLPLFRSIEVDQNITRLIDIYGGCERIMKTPVPLSYTR